MITNGLINFCKKSKKYFLCQMQVPVRSHRMVNQPSASVRTSAPKLEIDRQSKSRRHDHSFPESHWERGLFYDFKILLVVAILAQAFHVTRQYFF